jgi:hypothetical protein
MEFDTLETVRCDSKAGTMSLCFMLVESEEIPKHTTTLPVDTPYSQEPYQTNPPLMEMLYKVSEISQKPSLVNTQQDSFPNY